MHSFEKSTRGAGSKDFADERPAWLFQGTLFLCILLGSLFFSPLKFFDGFALFFRGDVFHISETAEAGERPWIEHEISSGDSLESLSARYGVDARAILRANELTDGLSLGEGDVVLVPKTQVDIPVTLAEVRSRRKVLGDEETSASAESRSGLDEEGRLISAGTIASRLPREAALPSPSLLRPLAPSRGVDRASLELERRRGMTYAWPLEGGEVSSPFGWRRGRNGKKYFHDGMDIRSPRGTPILAARDGTVIRTAHRGGYGKTVTVDHGDGVLTSYSHCQEILVRKGDTVRQGQKIATVGRTGRATGYHLHFRVIVNGKVKDPADFLPSR
jgi:murein DD-endopeptidase MepM/ murein hydrolase activator NlpD